MIARLAETVYALTIISFVLHLALFDYPGFHHLSADQGGAATDKTGAERQQGAEQGAQQKAKPTLKPTGNTDLGVGLEGVRRQTFRHRAADRIHC